MTTLEMEIRLANYFNFRRHIIIPNISWGMNVHECDLFIISSSGYVTEVEIKVSKHDLLNDVKKKHKHESKLIKKLFFAIPENLEPYIDSIPERAGIIIVAEKQIYTNSFKKGIKVIRDAQINKGCEKLSPKAITKVLRLGTMRIWPLKKKVAKLLN